MEQARTKPIMWSFQIDKGHRSCYTGSEADVLLCSNVPFLRQLYYYIGLIGQHALASKVDDFCVLLDISMDLPVLYLGLG